MVNLPDVLPSKSVILNIGLCLLSYLFTFVAVVLYSLGRSSQNPNACKQALDSCYDGTHWPHRTDRSTGCVWVVKKNQ